MGVYSRPDSPVWWLWLETTRQRERTKIRIGTTVDQKHDSRQLADDRYHQRMNELAARLYRLPSAIPAIRFSKYAATYKTNVIALRKGHEREAAILKILVAELGDELLTDIDADRVRLYMRRRRDTVTGRTVNREVDLLKSMLRDAVPKFLNESPLKGLKRLAVTTPRRRVMTEAEEAQLLGKADAVETALLLLGIDGLIRMSDILELQRSDRAGEWLHIADPKSGESYEVALSVRAAAALDALGDTGTYYFGRYRGAKMDRDRRGRVRKALMRLCKRAQVDYGKTTGGITFHWATRMTGATRLVVTHRASIPAVQRQGNWKTSDVLLSIYAQADREAQKEAVALPHRSRAKRKSA